MYVCSICIILSSLLWTIIKKYKFTNTCTTYLIWKILYKFHESSLISHCDKIVCARFMHFFFVYVQKLRKLNKNILFCKELNNWKVLQYLKLLPQMWHYISIPSPINMSIKNFIFKNKKVSQLVYNTS